MKKSLLLSGVVVFSLLAFVALIGINTPNAEKGSANAQEKEVSDWEKEVEDQQKEQESNEVMQVDQLAVGGNSNPEEYTSNFHLHMAHIDSGAITQNVTFNNGGEPLGNEVIKDSLENMKYNLEEINHTGEEEKDIQKAIDLTNQAIKEEAQKGDQVLEDIHDVVHNIDEHFNGKNIDVEVDEFGVPINEEDRIPNYEYNND